MFLSEFDKRYQAFRTAVVRSVKEGTTFTEGELGLLQVAAFSPDNEKAVKRFCDIGKFRVMKDFSEEKKQTDFYSSTKWFAEAMSSKCTSAILFNRDTHDIIVVDFYDKEYDYYAIDFLDESCVDFSMPMKDITGAYTRRMTDKYWLSDRFDDIIVLQFQGDK